MAYTVVSFSLWVIDSTVLYLDTCIYLSSSYFWSSYNISIFLFHLNPREQLVISHKDHIANVCSSYKAWKRKQHMIKLQTSLSLFVCRFNFSYRVKARKLLQTTHTNKNSCSTVEMSCHKNPSKHFFSDTRAELLLRLYFFPWRRCCCRRQRQRQRERQENYRFRSAKQLCTCITLFCTFLWRHCTTTTWKIPNFTFCEERRFFSFLELR